MSSEPSAGRSDAAARAVLLAARAKELRRAQQDILEKTSRELTSLAHAAALFFATLPLMEFSPALFPQTARAERRIRHRVLHRTVSQDESGMSIRALLLGRDAMLRMFIARSPLVRDLLAVNEPGTPIPPSVRRSVEVWTPSMRVPEFQPFDILDRLWQVLDSVERSIAHAEARVALQAAALDSGDPTSLRAISAPVASVVTTAPLVSPSMASDSVVTPVAAPVLISPPTAATVPDAGAEFNWDALVSPAVKKPPRGSDGALPSPGLPLRVASMTPPPLQHAIIDAPLSHKLPAH
jgi:hypothetical protein